MTTVNITLANHELKLLSDQGTEALLRCWPFMYVIYISDDIESSVINSFYAEQWYRTPADDDLVYFGVSGQKRPVYCASDFSDFRERQER